MNQSGDLDSVDLTQEEVCDLLEQVKIKYQCEIDTLIAKNQNKTVAALNENVSSDEINNKQQIYVNNLQKHIREDIPKNFPLPNTVDIDESLIQFLEEELKCMQTLATKTKLEIEEYQRDINELNKKKNSLNDMKEAYLNSNRNKEYQNYVEVEKRIKNYFKEVKQDLIDVVNTIFPDNGNFDELLSDLTTAYTVGAGDDVYIDVKEEYQDLIRFLVNADLVAYHPYDKTKIKLMDLL